MSTDVTIDPDEPAEPADERAVVVPLTKRAPATLVADIDELDDEAAEDYGGELVSFDPPEPWPVSPLRGGLERFAGRPMPTLHSTYASGRWWIITLTRAGVQVVVHSPQLILYQVPPIARGIGKGATRYAVWRAQAEWMAAAQAAEDKDRAKKIAEVKARQRANARITLLLGLAVLGGAVAAWLLGYGAWVLLTLLVLLVIADIVGRKDKPVTHNVAVMPRSGFREGAPVAMVMADVRAVLVESGHDTERLAVTEPRVGEYGLSMKVHSPREIGEGEVTAIERGLQTFRGAVSILAEPDNAALSELRIMWRDPLAELFIPPRCAPNSLSVAVPGVLGYGLGHAPLRINAMRTNIIIVGAPGSGKSSALWALIDWLSCCHDVVLHGIDLSGGPALRVWGDVFETRAFDKATARDLLERNIARSMARTEILAERSEPRPGMPAPQSEHWTPADAAAGLGKFHITIIDELPLLAQDPDLRGLYAEHQRIGRKAGDTSVGATQDLSGDTLGATSLRKYPSTVILMACSREDVTSALGGGKIKEGWTPHRFVAAEGDSPNDAGKAFIKSGSHTRPVPWRFARLDDMGEIHRRAMERIEAGRPSDDDAAITPVHVIPEPLAGVAHAFRAHAEPAFLATVELLAELGEQGQDWTDRKLAAALKAHGISPARQRVDGQPTRGYLWADVLAALDGLGS